MASPSVLSQLPAAVADLHTAKAAQKLTFADIGKALGRDETWIAAVFFGQARPDAEEWEKLFKVLKLDHQLGKSFGGLQLGEQWFPTKGLGPMPPTDPCIYRLYEMVCVYGHPFKAVIHEKFGDGIMSLIAFESKINKVEKDGAPWVELVLRGKFLPYTKW